MVRRTPERRPSTTTWCSTPTIRVVDRVGPAGLTLAAVAQEVGLSAATLVQRFASKRGLLPAIARRGDGVAGAWLREASGATARRSGHSWAGLVDMSSSVASTDMLAHRRAFLQIDLADPEFHALALGHARRVRADVQPLLDAAVERGELREQDTARLAQAVKQPTTAR